MSLIDVVMAMISATARRVNSGESGEAQKLDRAYPRIAMRPARLSRAGRTRDEFAASGSDLGLYPFGLPYPDSIPLPAGFYP